MRLARTAPPLPRYTPGGIRTRSFRVEGPASSPFDHGGLVWPAGVETGIRPGYPNRRDGRLPYSQMFEAPAAGIEPAPRD